jgi:hypothetical protein
MISAVLILFASLFKGIMDTLKFRFYKSIFYKPAAKWYRFVEPDSWKNKYRHRDVKHGRAFFLSTTVLVFVTDAWHLAQFVMKASFILAVVFYQPVFTWYFDFIIYSIIFSAIFELTFSKILIK